MAAKVKKTSPAPQASRSSKSTKAARKHDAEAPSPVFEIEPADVQHPPVPVHDDIPFQKPTVLDLPPDPEKRGTGGFIHEFRRKSEKSRTLRMAGVIVGAAATVAAVTGIIASAVINAERLQRQRKKKKK